MVVTADTIAAAQAQKSLHLAAHFLALLLGQLLTMCCFIQKLPFRHGYDNMAEL